MSSVVLEILANDGNIVWPGQDGGFMGPAWHPQMRDAMPTTTCRRRLGRLTQLVEVPEVRLEDRGGLWQRLDAHFSAWARNGAGGLPRPRPSEGSLMTCSTPSKVGSLRPEREPASRFGRPMVPGQGFGQRRCWRAG